MRARLSHTADSLMCDPEQREYACVGHVGSLGTSGKELALKIWYTSTGNLDSKFLTLGFHFDLFYITIFWNMIRDGFERHSSFNLSNSYRSCNFSSFNLTSVGIVLVLLPLVGPRVPSRVVTVQVGTVTLQDAFCSVQTEFSGLKYWTLGTFPVCKGHVCAALGSLRWGWDCRLG